MVNEVLSTIATQNGVLANTRTQAQPTPNRGDSS